MKASSQTLHACGHTFAVSENGRSGHQNVGARLDRKTDSCRIDAPIHFQIAHGLGSRDHLADAPDLGQGRLEEMLSETRVDRHN